MNAINIIKQPTYEVEFDSKGSAVLKGENKVVEWNTFCNVDDQRIANIFFETVPEELADLVDLAKAVYATDRLARRKASSENRYHLHWSRELCVTVPLRNPARWRNQSLYNQLIKVLSFLTDDKWHFDFTLYEGSGRTSEVQRFLFPNPVPQPARVALFSGGLDSLAGLYNDFIKFPEFHYILISINTNPRLQDIQQKLIRALPSRMHISITPVPIHLELCWQGKSHNEEQTQRSRGFLFMVLGAVTAMMANLDEVAVYENGVGAISLPYTDAQLGAHNTRSAHPRALYEMKNLINLASERVVKFNNPLLFVTKGEACKGLKNSDIEDLINVTVSCDRFPQRIANHSQCGCCTSCILRRQALFSAGLHSIDQENYSYRSNIFSNLDSLADEQLYHFRAMLYQVTTIQRALESNVPWHALCKIYPELFEINTLLSMNEEKADSFDHKLLELYRNYCEEWNRFPARPPAWPLN